MYILIIFILSATLFICSPFILLGILVRLTMKEEREKEEQFICCKAEECNEHCLHRKPHIEENFCTDSGCALWCYEEKEEAIVCVVSNKETSDTAS